MNLLIIQIFFRSKTIGVQPAEPAASPPQHRAHRHREFRLRGPLHQPELRGPHLPQCRLRGPRQTLLLQRGRDSIHGEVCPPNTLLLPWKYGKTDLLPKFSSLLPCLNPFFASFICQLPRILGGFHLVAETSVGGYPFSPQCVR